MMKKINTIDKTCRIGGDSVLDEAGELLLVGVLVLLHQVAHVLGHIHAHDVFAVNLSVELLALWVVAREALGAGGGKKRQKLGETFTSHSKIIKQNLHLFL